LAIWKTEIKRKQNGRKGKYVAGLKSLRKKQREGGVIRGQSSATEQKKARQVKNEQKKKYLNVQGVQYKETSREGKKYKQQKKSKNAEKPLFTEKNKRKGG